MFNKKLYRRLKFEIQIKFSIEESLENKVLNIKNILLEVQNISLNLKLSHVQMYTLYSKIGLIIEFNFI